ncbi:Alpha/Beta hydrolase protein, partial [Globomyces pollinis-pini]
ILILPGLFGSKQNWKSISKSLCKKLDTKICALDLRNHGDSPHSDVHDYDSMADDVSYFVKKHGWDKVTLIGHSMGGKVSINLALNPNLNSILDRLIIVDMAPVRQSTTLSSGFRSYVDAMKKVSQSKVSGTVEADKILAESIPSVEVRQFLLTNLKKDSNGKYDFRINLEALGKSLPLLWDLPYQNSSEPPVYNKSVLFIAGGKSHYVTEYMHPTIRKLFPSAQIITIPDAGHWVHAEKPDEFIKTVVNYIQ